MRKFIPTALSLFMACLFSAISFTAQAASTSDVTVRTKTENQNTIYEAVDIDGKIVSRLAIGPAPGLNTDDSPFKEIKVAYKDESIKGSQISFVDTNGGALSKSLQNGFTVKDNVIVWVVLLCAKATATYDSATGSWTITVTWDCPFSKYKVSIPTYYQMFDKIIIQPTY